MNRLRAAVLVLVVGLGLTACGGDDSSLSKAEYIKAAKAVERRVEAGTGKLGSTEPKNSTEVATLFESLKDEVVKARDDLSSLEPPSKVRKAHDKTIEAAKLLVADLDAIIKAARGGDTAKLQQLVTSGFPSKAAEAAGDESDRLYEQAGYEELAGK